MKSRLKRKVELEILFASSLAVLVGSVSNADGQAAARESTNSSPANASSADVEGPSTDLVVITLDEAIRRAQANEPTYAAAVAASRSAGLDKSISRAGLLPSVRLYSQDIYSQPNGIYTEGDAGELSAPLPRFIANDSRPREYIAQGVIDETLGLGESAAVHRADATAAMAVAEQEIARRGLVVTVTSLFYGSLAADHKLAVAEDARNEARGFTRLTNNREQAREAAHADVVKAQLVEQQRDRDYADAKVAADKAHLELGVLLFSDPRTPCTLSEPHSAAPLASHEDVEQAAAKNNPELKSALALLDASKADVQAAWGALLPNVVLNFTYGIDANRFATNGPLVDDAVHPNGIQARNLGYSASVTVNLPIWDWLASEHKVKQSEIRRDATQVALNAAQRRLIAQLDEVYSETQVASDQLVSLDASVNTAAESLRLTKLRYGSGEAAVLEVVDAQTAYVSAANAREDGRVRYETARAELAMITGTM
jgi:outer membrane protein TolC